MSTLSSALLPFFVCLGFAVLMGFFALMYRWARRQKGVAMAFGMLVQMFLPDPNAQQTIECVAQSKQEQIKPSQSSEGEN